MKKYNCPDCGRTDSCDGCFRIAFMPTDNDTSVVISFNDDPCDKCTNNIKNGGPGSCNCILSSSIKVN